MGAGPAGAWRGWAGLRTRLEERQPRRALGLGAGRTRRALPGSKQRRWGVLVPEQNEWGAGAA